MPRYIQTFYKNGQLWAKIKGKVVRVISSPQRVVRGLRTRNLATALIENDFGPQTEELIEL